MIIKKGGSNKFRRTAEFHYTRKKRRRANIQPPPSPPLLLQIFEFPDVAVVKVTMVRLYVYVWRCDFLFSGAAHPNAPIKRAMGVSNLTATGNFKLLPASSTSVRSICWQTLGAKGFVTGKRRLHGCGFPFDLVKNAANLGNVKESGFQMGE